MARERPGADLRYRDTLDHLLEGFQIIGFDWTYRYLNPAAARHGRQPVEALIGRTMMDAYPGIDRTPVFAVMQTVMSARTPAALENCFAYPDGTTRWFELRVEPVPEGICVFSVDIEDRKAAEAALRQLNDDLEAQVAARTRELESANRDLEAFTYSVSHDLRAPVRHIAGFARVVQEEDGDRLSEEGRAALERIVAAGSRLGRLIEDLLRLSRLGRIAIEPHPVDLAAVVRRARADVTAGDEASGVEWTIGALPSVSGDPELLRAALVNLFSNAIKFSRGRTPPRIEVGADALADTPEVVVVRVRDNGVGFDPQYADRLFGVFQRLHREEEFEGTGIGLANVRRIIDRHGGRTWAESVPGQGATFYFTLPRAGDD
jgi:PAS domain S-box-containing protein